MLSRDYISRIIRTFFDSLELIFTGDKEREEERKAQLESMYTTYFGQSRDFFFEEKVEEIMERLWKRIILLKNAECWEKFYTGNSIGMKRILLNSILPIKLYIFITM